MPGPGRGACRSSWRALQYHLPRLTRMWTHLSRTGGGIGTRGPGESQLETDRRLIRERSARCGRELEDGQAPPRHRRPPAGPGALPTVALVGYTNAGKSTLFNALTAAGAYAADMLFATLDPTARRVACRLASGSW